MTADQKKEAARIRMRNLRASRKAAAAGRGPGLARLRAAPEAETIRKATLADQKTGLAAVTAFIEAGRAASRTAKGGPRARPAAIAPARAETPAHAPRKLGGRHAELRASAERGVVPSPPDFTAPTHTRFRAKLAAVVALVEAGDVEALRAYAYKGFLSSSPKAIMRYRDLALVALEARAAA